MEGDYNDFLSAMFHRDLDAMNEYMNTISIEIFSSFDTGQPKESGSVSKMRTHTAGVGLKSNLKDIKFL